MPNANFVLDADYDLVPEREDAAKPKLGSQCGKCGMKFVYGQSHGYACPQVGCPMRSATGF